MSNGSFDEITEALKALRNAPDPTGTIEHKIRELHRRAVAQATASLAMLRILKRDHERLDSAVGAIGRMGSRRK